MHTAKTAARTHGRKEETTVEKSAMVGQSQRYDTKQLAAVSNSAKTNLNQQSPGVSRWQLREKAPPSRSQKAVQSVNSKCPQPNHDHDHDPRRARSTDATLELSSSGAAPFKLRVSRTPSSSSVPLLLSFAVPAPSAPGDEGFPSSPFPPDGNATVSGGGGSGSALLPDSACDDWTWRWDTVTHGTRRHDQHEGCRKNLHEREENDWGIAGV